MPAALAFRCYRLTRTAFFSFALCCIALATQAESVSGQRLADEVFEINVRPAGCTTDEQRLAASILVREYALSDAQGSRQWFESSLEQLTTASPNMRTIIFVHGNKVDACAARSRSLRVYRTLVSRAMDDQPIRLVIFSWPAAEVKGFLYDFRAKAARTQPVGWQLAWVLNQFPPDAEVSLLGYSYGARIISGALHVLAGGCLNGHGLDGTYPSGRAPMRVAYVAAGLPAHWMGPHQFHGLAMMQIDELMLLNNELDPAMRYYGFVEKNSNPQAMGLRGPICLAPEDRHRVRNYDCSNCVGRSHDLFQYLSTGHTITVMWQHLVGSGERIVQHN